MSLALANYLISLKAEGQLLWDHSMESMTFLKCIQKHTDNVEFESVVITPSNCLTSTDEAADAVKWEWTLILVPESQPSCQLSDVFTVM